MMYLTIAGSLCCRCGERAEKATLGARCSGGGCGGGWLSAGGGEARRARLARRPPAATHAAAAERLARSCDSWVMLMGIFHASAEM